MFKECFSFHLVKLLMQDEKITAAETLIMTSSLGTLALVILAAIL